MDLELPADIQMLQQTIRKFVDRELIPIETKARDGGALMPEYRAPLEKKAKELGLWLLDAPAEVGGQGLSLLALAVVWQELARTIALPPRGPGIFGPDVRSILLALNPEQKERYLFPVLRGEKNTCFAQTEPDAGSDPGGMRTTAMREGDHYVINGAKRFILHAREADFIQLVAATDRAKGSHGGLSVFLVDMETPGVTLGASTRHMMGETTEELHFDNVRVPVENRVGAEGEGMKFAQAWIGASRVYQAARGLGVASRCLDLMTSYAKQRVTFGRPLADRQAVQFMVADLYTQLHAGQMLTHYTAQRIDQGIAARQEAMMIKIFCTELGFHAADRCMQVFGGMGLTEEMPIEQMWRDARSFMITGGPVEILRASLARAIFEQVN
ncbi:acyl-CoA/acyl-ACP dehydrogenase [Microbacteriaceae bacterium K1510]|nr:acyl-CoA/acyl-ACP dehydrogenase [Microbacteriaceae bacterium K1510]